MGVLIQKTTQPFYPVVFQLSRGGKALEKGPGSHPEGIAEEFLISGILLMQRSMQPVFHCGPQSDQMLTGGYQLFDRGNSLHSSPGVPSSQSGDRRLSIHWNTIVGRVTRGKGELMSPIQEKTCPEYDMPSYSASDWGPTDLTDIETRRVLAETPEVKADVPAYHGAGRTFWMPIAAVQQTSQNPAIDIDDIIKGDHLG